MIGIAIEASTSCPSCGNLLALNAMVPKMLCNQCGAVTQLGAGLWESLLGDAIREAPRSSVNEGSSSRVFSKGLAFEITYGTILLLGYSGQLRVFSAAGGLVYASEASRKKEAEALKKAGLAKD
ncbi:MAG: hypothetical protein ABIJ56_03170 [Pseudomonadota bacterium]